MLAGDHPGPRPLIDISIEDKGTIQVFGPLGSDLFWSKPSFSTLTGVALISMLPAKNPDATAKAPADDSAAPTPTLTPEVYPKSPPLKTKHEYDKAILNFKFTEAIQLAPNQATLLDHRGATYVVNKDYDKALVDLNEAIRLDPKLASAYESRGSAWSAKNALDKAIADFNEAIRLDPQRDKSFVSRGLALCRKREYDKAVADFNEAIRLNPKNASACYGRGSAWMKQKVFDKALADYAETLRLDPNYAEAHQALAWIWATCPDAKYRDGKKAMQAATTGA